MPPLSSFFWWLPLLSVLAVFALLSFLFWPVTCRVFGARPDRGAALAPAGGFFVAILAAQLQWRLSMGAGHGMGLWMLLLGAGGFLWWRFPPPALRPRLVASLRRGVAWFSLSLFFWGWLRAADPAVAHTEQPMDLMWMRAAMTASEPPIRDAWFAGAPASYYVDGHQMLAFLALLAGQDSPIAVNTTQAALFALCVLLCAEGMPSRRPFPLRGALSVLLCLFASTPRGAWDALFGAQGHWWWWRATRVLYDGDTSLITEFPFFSFWLGDNHAHLIGVAPFLLGVAGAVQLGRARRPTLLLCLPSALAVLWSWRVHPWQAPAALGLFAIGLLSRRRLRLSDFLPPLYALACMLPLLWPTASGGLFQGISPNRFGHSSLIDLLAVFAFLLPGLAGLLLPTTLRTARWLPLLALGLLLLCELLVVRDAFQNRMNTVFKLYYQAWILLALASAAGMAEALRHPRTRRAALLLPFFALPAWFYSARLCGEAFAAPRRSLDAWASLPEDTRQLLSVADSLVGAGDLIAEAVGESYAADTSLLGTWTAGDTLVGWPGHEAQWRPGVPHANPALLYEAETEDRLHAVLHAFGFRWILLGPRERSLYSIHPDWTRWMDRLANRAVENPTFLLYHVRR